MVLLEFKKAASYGSELTYKEFKETQVMNINKIDNFIIFQSKNLISFLEQDFLNFVYCLDGL